MIRVFLDRSPAKQEFNSFADFIRYLNKLPEVAEKKAVKESEQRKKTVTNQMSSFKICVNNEKEEVKGLKGLFAVPGCGKDEVDISVNDKREVVISYLNHFDTTNSLSEQSTIDEPTLNYCFTVPEDFSIDSVEATITNGLLTLFFARINKKQTARKIEIG